MEETAAITTRKAPHITKVLEGATTDLQNAELPGFVGKVFNPVRENILVPVTEKATHIIPTVVDAVPIPFVDEATALFVSVPVGATKLGYSFLPYSEVDKEADSALVAELDNLGDRLMNGSDFEESDFESESEPAPEPESDLEPEESKAGEVVPHKRGRRFHRPKPILSSLMGVIGFGANTVLDIVTLPFNGKLGDWMYTSKRFLGYLVYSGVGKDLLSAFANLRAFDNIIIIGHVQAANNEIGCGSRRERTAMTSLPPNMTPEKFKNIMKDAARYVRYSTAAYGVSQIDSANLLQVFGKKIVVIPLVESASRKLRIRKMARHVGVKEEKIVYVTPLGGSMSVLRHFVAVDKRKTSTGSSQGAVVLAIRGTYTLSGAKVDLQAFTMPYCDGLAHRGIAETSELLWDAVKDKVINALLDNEGYDLVITGHSLGAGAAALISLKLNHEKLLGKEDPRLKDVKVRCFAFAPPPVYLPSKPDQSITNAMEDIHSFIHENDVVPHLSADAVRRLADTIKEVDDFAKRKIISRPLMAWGLKQIPQEVTKIVMDKDTDIEWVPDAERLAVPSPYVIWMRDVNNNDKDDRPVFNAMFCRPKHQNDGAGTNDLNMMMDIGMISDHMNPKYERAVNSILSQVLRKKQGYAFPLPKECSKS